MKKMPSAIRVVTAKSKKTTGELSDATKAINSVTTNLSQKQLTTDLISFKKGGYAWCYFAFGQSTFNGNTSAVSAFVNFVLDLDNKLHKLHILLLLAFICVICMICYLFLKII